MSLNNIHKAILALIIANIIWGATPPILKWALEDVPPFTLAFFRFFIASVIILPFIRHSKLKIERRDWPKLFTLAFVGIFLHISFFFLGLELAPSINVPVIASAAPIFLMIASIVILKEHPGSKKIAGATISLIGVLIIVLLPFLNEGSATDYSILGNIFFIIGTSGAVVHAISLKSIAAKYEPLTLLFWSFVIASIMFFPMFFNEFRDGSLANIGTQGAAGIVFGSIFSSFAAYFLLYWAMKYVLASEAGIFTYISPVVAIIIAGALLGEHPSSTYLLGSIFVFLGIYISEGHLYHHVHLFRH